uniref:Pol polyprotein n=1 Tax=Cajanus cajan TaxID=3821 RepID=A0A151U2L1_CAJCA|nr:Pol polyprotein [Cajanus cajan]
MGPFPSSQNYKYILVAVDYVFEWVEATLTQTCDAKTIIKLFKKIIFPRFGVPRVVISDRGSHFIKRQFETLLSKYKVTHKYLGKTFNITDLIEQTLNHENFFYNKLS